VARGLSYSLSSSLRKLTRRHPEEGSTHAVLRAMQGDLDDRAAALTMASLVDGALLAAISALLRIAEQKLFGDLFYQAGPFASFDQRIVACRALRIIGQRATHNLYVIKDLRNVFAHAMSGVSFASPEIKDACDKLILSDDAKLFVVKETEKPVRFTFGCACQEIYGKLFSFVISQVTGKHPA
jgi:hypothetical protein